MIPKRQRLRPARQPAPYSGFEDRDEEDEDEAHFREIPEKDSFDYEVGIETCSFPQYTFSNMLQLFPGDQTVCCLWEGDEEGRRQQRPWGEQHEGLELLPAVRPA